MVLLLATSLVVLSAKRDDPHPPTITKLNAASENAASAATRWWLHSCLAGRSGEKSFGHRPPVLFAFGVDQLNTTAACDEERVGCFPVPHLCERVPHMFFFDIDEILRVHELIKNCSGEMESLITIGGSMST